MYKTKWFHDDLPEDEEIIYENDIFKIIKKII